MTDQTFGMSTRPILKRPRPVLSCLECRRKKLKCDRFLPCQQCLKINQPSSCTYAPGQEPESRGEALEESRSLSKQTRHDGAVDVSRASSDLINDLQDRVRRLEESLRIQQQHRSLSHVSESQNQDTSREPEIVEYILPKPQPEPEPELNIHREFSIYDQFEDALRFGRSLKQRHHDETIRAISVRLFNIDRAISISDTTDERDPEVGLLSTTHSSSLVRRMEELLPELSVREKLLTLYFENFHHCGRLLHRPSFLLQNQWYNRGVLDKSGLPNFVPVLLGVLCVASSLNTFPECEVLLRQDNEDRDDDGTRPEQDVTRLIEEWYNTHTRSRGVPTLSAIQAMVLTMQAQRARRSSLARLWALSAQVVRHAMAIGLHRPSLPSSVGSSKMNAVDREVRRCVWLTILEQDLALSISNEMPPFGVTYDLEPPSNIDDDDVSVFTTSASTQGHVQYPPDKWTDGLCQHILGKSFNQRLQAYTYRLSRPRSALPGRTREHYDNLKKHVRTLESTLQNLPPLFRLGQMTTDQDTSANTPGRLMAQMDLDISLRRPLIATCAPYARLMPSDDTYRDVRIPWVQSHLVVMCFQDLFDPQYPAIDVPRPRGYWDFFFTYYRHDVVRSVEAMLLEGRFLKYHSRGGGPGGGGGENNATTSKPSFSTSTSPTSIKTMPWNFEAIMKSIEDSLEPMTRRIGLCGAELEDVVRGEILFFCLRVGVGAGGDKNGGNNEVDRSITSGLLELIDKLTSILEGERQRGRRFLRPLGSTGDVRSFVMDGNGDEYRNRSGDGNIDAVEWFRKFLDLG